MRRFQPSAWTEAHAAHLLRRAGFGGTPAEIRSWHALGLKGAVEKLIAGEEDDDLFPPPVLTGPAGLDEQRTQIRQAEGEEAKRELRKVFRREQVAQIKGLRRWWLNRMRYTPHPLREKMTLFWHGHFATSFEKVRVAYLMWQQNETLRSQALGNFRELTQAVSRDPAMMVYLDVASSNRAQPNENFARELLELFMLGEGVRYTEDDIREAAKAFTGYRISRQTQSFRFDKKQFDSSEKAFFGRRGKFDGDAVINIVLDQPECAEFIVGKLWKFLASDAPPPPQVLADLSSRFRSSGFEVPAVLEELFLSEAFYAPDVVGRQVKSPVQWLVQSSKMLEVPLPPPEVLDVAFLQMGQVPFAPPNVKGWEGGRTWISSSTLLFRCNLAGYLIRGNTRGLGVSQEVPRVSGMDLDRIAPPELRSDPALLCGQLVRRLLPVPPSAAEQQRFLAFLEEGGQPVSDAVIYDLLHVMMSTPEFQLT